MKLATLDTANSETTLAASSPPSPISCNELGGIETVAVAKVTKGEPNPSSVQLMPQKSTSMPIYRFASPCSDSCESCFYESVLPNNFSVALKSTENAKPSSWPKVSKRFQNVHDGSPNSEDGIKERDARRDSLNFNHSEFIDRCNATLTENFSAALKSTKKNTKDEVVKGEDTPLKMAPIAQSKEAKQEIECQLQMSIGTVQITTNVIQNGSKSQNSESSQKGSTLLDIYNSNKWAKRFINAASLGPAPTIRKAKPSSPPPLPEIKEMPTEKVVRAKRVGNKIIKPLVPPVGLSNSVATICKVIKAEEPAPLVELLVVEDSMMPKFPFDIKESLFDKVTGALKVVFSKVLMFNKKSLPSRRRKGIIGFRILRLFIRDQ